MVRHTGDMRFIPERFRTKETRGLDGQVDHFGMSPAQKAIAGLTLAVTMSLSTMLLLRRAAESDARDAVRKKAEAAARAEDLQRETLEKERRTLEDRPPVRPSVWEQRGDILKGSVVYIPTLNQHGKETMVSMQFVDEGRRTILLIDGREYEQTADGFPLFVSSIHNDGERITVSGRALFMVPGQSTWSKQHLSDLCVALREHGSYEFPIDSIVAAKGLIRAREPIVESSSAEVEEER